MKRRSGFTLVEVLIVIAVIGILTSILLPSLRNARISSSKHQAKVQFHRMGLALENYWLEYGKYPDFFKSNEPINIKEHAEDFKKALAGAEKGKEHPSNKKGIEFYSFSEKELDNKNVVDIFGNPNIYIAVDSKGTGILELKDDKLIKGGKLHGRVAIYTLKEYGPKEGYQDVFSWK